MPDTTTICKNCQFENHATCHFCIRCGDPMNAAESRATTTVLAEVGGGTAGTTPRRDIVEAIGDLIEQSDFRSRETASGFLVEVPLDGERTQHDWAYFAR